MRTACILARLGPAHIKGHDGFMGGYSLGRFNKLTTPGDPFNIKGDDLRVGTGAQVFHTIDNINIGLIPHTQRRAESHPMAMKEIKHLGNKTPALVGKADETGGAFCFNRSRIQFKVRVGNAKTVRSEKTDAVLKGDGLQLFLHLDAFGARFPEASGYYDGMLDAFLSAILSLIHISEPTRLGMISYAVF